MTKAVGFESHNHDTCIARTMRAVEARCADRKLQLTPVRRRVMEILLEHHRAMGAYDILEVLRAEGLGSQPPVAYRALEFLRTHGFVHRVERLNGFIACVHPEADHDPAFLICSACHAVAETEAQAISGAMAQAGNAAGFEVSQMVVEAEGLCPDCRSGAKA
ncbi:MAG: transcriptional repressor [Rhodobacteraceae bacterium]|nr:transcriptional repressor [Paracoccaceae bacterium]